MRRFVWQAALLVVLAIVPAGVSLFASHANASVAYESPYTFEQTFGTAFRLIRVDLSLKITEKDIENGYLLFDYTSPESGKQVHPGSIEVVRGRETVHVAVQLPALPSYHEQMIVDALARKLVTEHGDPPKKNRPAPPSGDDAGTGDANPSASRRARYSSFSMTGKLSDEVALSSGGCACGTSGG
jgi:hypothetical protein